MTAPEATRLAAIIAGVIALLSVAINVASAQLIRWQDRRERERDWRRDLQVRDLAEIVATLTVFSRDFRSCIEKLGAGQSGALRDIHTVVESLEHRQYVEPVFIRFLQTFYDRYETDSNELWALNTRTRDWFDGEAKRLSLWFDDEDGVEAMLDELGERVQTFHVSMHQTTARLWTFVGRYLDNQKDGRMDVDEAEQLHSAFVSAASAWPEVDALIFAAQKRLARRFKPTKTTSAQRLASDGLLVEVARWTEARLRWLLHMR